MSILTGRLGAAALLLLVVGASEARGQADSAGVAVPDSVKPEVRDSSRFSWFVPWAEWRYNVGPVIGGGPIYIGTRRRGGVRFLYSPSHARFGMEAQGELRRGSRSRITGDMQASGLVVTRFHGFGNDTPDTLSSNRYKVWETLFLLQADYRYRTAPWLELSVGPEVRWTSPDPANGGPADSLRPFGSDSYGVIGGRAGLVADRRDSRAFPRHGFRAEMSGSIYPDLWDSEGVFGGTQAVASGYLPIALPLESTGAVRIGGSTAWGDYPLQLASFLGGSGSVRGLPRQRYAGDAAIFAGAELRSKVTDLFFYGQREIGTILFVDAGRVFYDGDDSDEFHTGFGGGIWTATDERRRVMSLVLGIGSDYRSFYFDFGMPF